MKKIVIGGAILVTLLSVAGYAWLGGFQTEKISEVSHPRQIVYGTTYQGKYGDLKLREIVVKTKQLLEDPTLSGRLVVVNYDSTAASEEINQLIGIITSDASSEALQNLTQDSLAEGSYLRVQLYGHPVVRSTPEQVDQKVKKYAEQRQLTLGEEVIEHYFESDSMWIEYSVEGKQQ
ncbi:hypothetical protein [Tunicatimonas pelagia]|uniref:hypothetical protein n=1 Tax=Tunicatimonas pelagia TaxID=931531 RepID=UPI0026664B3B|nr:hypothetical protein [Tunicatimonas pelagia]WKN40857.1 hypothetical protein P0M28_17620 [Tunicatimonas pelagia]